MILTESELSSPVWDKIKKHYEARIQTLRAENDKNMNDIETATLRGRIREAKLVLDLGNPKPKIDYDE
jgi:hypothetical protein